jgi:hypothetical protein
MSDKGECWVQRSDEALLWSFEFRVGTQTGYRSEYEARADVWRCVSRYKSPGLKASTTLGHPTSGKSLRRETLAGLQDHLPRSN